MQRPLIIFNVFDSHIGNLLKSTLYTFILVFQINSFSRQVLRGVLESGKQERYLQFKVTISMRPHNWAICRPLAVLITDGRTFIA